MQQTLFAVNAEDIPPTDMEQCKIRMAIVSIILLASIYAASGNDVLLALSNDAVTFTAIYWIFSALLTAWIYLLNNKFSTSYHLYVVSRTISIAGDVSAMSIYTALAGQYGALLYPLFMTSAIGYGYRFGLPYLWVTLACSIVAFTLCFPHNDYLLSNRPLVYAYYLSIIVVPIYSASLLRKYREALAHIKSVSNARTRFIANLSHELRTPLHAIISLADSIGESRATGATLREIERKIGVIGEAANHLLTLANRVLNIAAAEAGRLPPPKLDRTHLLSSVLAPLRIVQPTAIKKGIALNWTFSAHLPEYAITSEPYLKDILLNLLSNAIKHTSTGKVSVSAALIKQDVRDVLELRVIDTGSGIASNAIKRIFEPFAVGDDSATRTSEGFGLGLALTKSYVDQLGGTIRIDSSQGHGTSCIIRIPIVPAHTTQHEDTRAEDDAFFTTVGVIGIELLYASESDALTQAKIRAVDVGSNFDAPLLPNMTNALIILAHSINDLLSISTAFRAKNVELIIIGVLRPHTIGLDPIVLEDLDSNVADIDTLNFFTSIIDRDICRHISAALAACSPPDSEARTLPEPTIAGKHVLVIDDNSVNLQAAVYALTPFGCDVVTETDAERGLDLLESSRFDVALVDIHMPSMSGVELAKIYSFIALEDPTPIVFLTADITEEASSAAQSAGGVAVLTKPLKPTDLRDAVRKYSKANTWGGDSEPSALLRSLGGAFEADSTLTELALDGVPNEKLAELLSLYAVDSRKQFGQISGQIDALSQGSRYDEQLVKELLHALIGSSLVVGALRTAAHIRSYRFTPGQPNACQRLLEWFGNLETTHAEEISILRETFCDTARRE